MARQESLKIKSFLVSYNGFVYGRNTALPAIYLNLASFGFCARTRIKPILSVYTGVEISDSYTISLDNQINHDISRQKISSIFQRCFRMVSYELQKTNPVKQTNKNVNYIPDYKTFRAFKNKFFSRSKYYLLFIMISPLFILGQKKVCNAGLSKFRKVLQQTFLM